MGLKFSVSSFSRDARATRGKCEIPPAQRQPGEKILQAVDGWFRPPLLEGVMRSENAEKVPVIDQALL